MADDNPFNDSSVSASASAPPPPLTASSAEPAWFNEHEPSPPPVKESQPSWLDKNEAVNGAPKPPAPAEPLAGADLMDISCLSMPRPIRAMRCCNVLSAFFLSLMASLKLGSGTAAISSGVIAIYLFAFAFLIAIFEVHCGCTARAIAHNLGFMYRATGRFMFFLLVGLLCFSGYHALGTFTGVFMLFTAVFNGFIMFKYPAYERSMRIVDLGE